MPVFIWIVAIVCAVVFIVGIVYAARGELLWGILAAIVALAIGVGSLFWLYGSAPGQRALKSFGSETSGGLTRVVTVYDMQGDQIAQYEGKFDIQTDDTKVFFDIPSEGEDSKRVQIWNGTVISEEK